MEQITLSSRILNWTTPKSNIVITNSLHGGDIEIAMLASKTCVFRGDIDRSDAIVDQAKAQLTRWAEDLRISLGAASFHVLSHPEYAPVITFYNANEGINNSPNACISINAIFRRMVAKVTLSLDDEVPREYRNKW